MPDLTVEQHELRRTRIGASEVGALMGPHPWTDPARIYARIIDGPDPSKQTAAMAAGHDLERAIGDVASRELGLRLRACSRTYTHPVLPLAASPDFYARDVKGSRGLVEVKLSRDWSDWLDGPPPWYEWQVRAQLALTGRGWGVLAALVGSSIQTHLIERDMSKELELLDAVSAFWARHLIPQNPPGTDREGLVLRWELKPGERIAGGLLEAAGDAYAEAVIARRSLERVESDRRAAFVEMLVDGSKTRTVLGPGWNAVVDERGALRFNVKR